MRSRWLDTVGLANGERLLRGAAASSARCAPCCSAMCTRRWIEMAMALRMIATPSTCSQFKPRSDDFAVDDAPPAWRTLTLHADGRLDTACLAQASSAGQADAQCVIRIRSMRANRVTGTGNFKQVLSHLGRHRQQLRQMTGDPWRVVHLFGAGGIFFAQVRPAHWPARRAARAIHRSPAALPADLPATQRRPDAVHPAAYPLPVIRNRRSPRATILSRPSGICAEIGHARPGADLRHLVDAADLRA